MEAEINHHLALFDHRAEVVPHINLRNHLQLRNPLRAGDQRLAHAPFGPGDDDSRAAHFRTPHCCMTAFNASRFFADIRTSGNRYSSSISPSSAKAAFTGIGLEYRLPLVRMSAKN